MTPASHGLTCAECGGTAPPGAHGWKGLLTVGDEAAEDEEQVAVFCPNCAEREFDAQ